MAALGNTHGQESNRGFSSVHKIWWRWKKQNLVKASKQILCSQEMILDDGFSLISGFTNIQYNFLFLQIFASDKSQWHQSLPHIWPHSECLNLKFQLWESPKTVVSVRALSALWAASNHTRLADGWLAILYSTVLYSVFNCTLLYCTLYSTVLYCTVLCIQLYSTVLYSVFNCTLLYCTLYSTVLYSTVLCIQLYSTVMYSVFNCNLLYCTLYSTVL